MIQTPNRWEEARQTLTDLLEWLDRSQQWCEARSAADRPGREPAEGDGDELSAERQAGHFAAADHWSAVPSTVLPATELPAAGESPDMFTLLQALTALRHELKLQTRSARQDREQAAQALEQLAAAVREGEQDRAEQAAQRQRLTEELQRASIELLADLHDALSRAARQAERVRDHCAAAALRWCRIADQQPLPGEGPATAGQPPAPTPGSDERAEPPTWWRRLWARLTAAPGRPSEPEGPAESSLRQVADEAAGVAGQLDALCDGYRLALSRLERALAQYEVSAIDCLGQPVDPECMEVVQTVAGPALPPGTVVDEVRRGYRRAGRLIRFAQVVATRPAATPANTQRPLPPG